MTGFFDKNTWYNVHFRSLSGNSLQTSGNYFFGPTKSYGSAFISPYNASQSDVYNFQFYPSPDNASEYIIRPSNARNPTVWLAAAQKSVWGDCGDDCSGTGLGVTNKTGDNAVWTVTPSGDGQTSFLSNRANGTEWRMSVDTTGNAPGSYLNLASVQGGNSSQARWQFVSAAKINDMTFSTLPPGFTSSPTSQPGQKPTQTPKSGNSVNIGAAVGGAVGGFVVLLLLAGVILFFMRRRKKSREAHHDSLPPYDGLYGDRKEEDMDKSVGRVEAPEQNQLLQAPGVAEEGMGADPVNRGEVFELPGRTETGEGRPRRMNRIRTGS